MPSKHTTDESHERHKGENTILSGLGVSVESELFGQWCMPLGPQARGGQEKVCCN